MSAPIPSPREDAGGRKRPASGPPFNEPGGKRPPADNVPIVLLRVACPLDKSGPVIGKGGEVIRSIRDTTGARVKVDDVPRGMHERAIIIFSPDRPGEPTCAAQDGLDRVITRMFEPDEGTVPAEEAKPPPERVELVLLIDRVYMGIIVGKGGENVNRIRNSSGCTVQIQPKGHGSVLEGPDEETIVIIGPLAGVRTAARGVLDRVREGVQRDNQPNPSTLAIAHTGRGGMPPGGPMAPEQPFLPPGVPPPPSGPTGPPIQTQYKMLVPDARVGSIIGKGGDRLKMLREQSRADVKVERAVEGVAERLVICGSWEPPEHEYCAAAEGLMMCSNRVVMDKTAVDAEGKVVLRLLAPSNQMGAVVGIQGRIIKQVSIDTGAQLVILPGAMMSRLGGADEEILEITGHPDQVMEATRIATMLLRGAMIRQQQAAPLQPPPAVAAQYGAAPAPAPAPYAPPAGGQGQYAPPAAPAAPGQYSYPPPGPGSAGQPYSYAGGAPAPAPPPSNASAPYDIFSAAAPPSGPSSYAAPPPQPGAPSDPYAGYYSQYGGAPPPSQPAAPPPPQSYGQGGYSSYADPSGPPPQSGYTSSYPSAPGGATNAYTYPPPSSQGGQPQQSGGGLGPAPPNPAPGSLHNPTMSSAGLPPGMVKYTFSVPTTHVGTLLGARGSNISAIRMASGARIKVADSQPGAQEREVEISGQAAQCSIAVAAVQSLMSTGKMPANIPH